MVFTLPVGPSFSFPSIFSTPFTIELRSSGLYHSSELILNIVFMETGRQARIYVLVLQ